LQPGLRVLLPFLYRVNKVDMIVIAPPANGTTGTSGPTA
jgi:hypothetical protein